MGAKGAAASAEAADVVLLVDRLDRVLQAIGIARRSCFAGGGEGQANSATTIDLDHGQPASAILSRCR
jgi:hypothetical protein